VNNYQDQSDYDVIISGAGPVGLFLAGELALANCSVLILEKAENPHSPLKRLPFGIRGLSAPTIEALYRRGLLDDLEVPRRLKNPHAGAVQGPRRQVGHFAGIPIHEGDIDTSQWAYRLPSSTETALISEMEELETVLARRAHALGVEIRRGFALTDFHQTGDGVSVQAGNQSFQSKWLVGTCRRCYAGSRTPTLLSPPSMSLPPGRIGPDRPPLIATDGYCWQAMPPTFMLRWEARVSTLDWVTP
jgi:2-polyprenyl-6-methoxyphenol hydroxylase-like FAD-dependent oxidoreductase